MEHTISTNNGVYIWGSSEGDAGDPSFWKFHPHHCWHWGNENLSLFCNRGTLMIYWYIGKLEFRKERPINEKFWRLSWLMILPGYIGRTRTLLLFDEELRVLIHQCPRGILCPYLLKVPSGLSVLLLTITIHLLDLFTWMFQWWHLWLCFFIKEEGGFCTALYHCVRGIPILLTVIFSIIISSRSINC